MIRIVIPHASLAMSISINQQVDEREWFGRGEEDETTHLEASMHEISSDLWSLEGWIASKSC